MQKLELTLEAIDGLVVGELSGDQFESLVEQGVIDGEFADNVFTIAEGMSSGYCPPELQMMIVEGFNAGEVSRDELLALEEIGAIDANLQISLYDLVDEAAKTKGYPILKGMAKTARNLALAGMVGAGGTYAYKAGLHDKIDTLAKQHASMSDELKQVQNNNKSLKEKIASIRGEKSGNYQHTDTSKMGLFDAIKAKADDLKHNAVEGAKVEGANIATKAGNAWEGTKDAVGKTIESLGKKFDVKSVADAGKEMHQNAQTVDERSAPAEKALADGQKKESMLNDRLKSVSAALAKYKK